MTVNRKTDAPDGFTTTFKQGYGSQEITSLPLKANESISMKPSLSVPAGRVLITFEAADQKASAQAHLALHISRQPSVTLTGQGERLSGEAYAGHAYVAFRRQEVRA